MASKNWLATSSSMLKKESMQLKSPLLALLCCLTSGAIPLGHPLASIDQLDNIDKLLECHHGSRNAGDDPRQKAVDLVGPSQFQSTRAPGAGEKAVGLRMGRVSGLRGRRCCIIDGLQEGRRESGRGERKQVKANEEEFIQGTADEKHSLQTINQISHIRQQLTRGSKKKKAYLAVIVLIQDPAPGGIDLLVALAGTTHA